LGSNFAKIGDEISRQVENETQGKKKKRKGKETNLVCMRTSLAIGRGFRHPILVRSSKYTNACNDAINYIYIT